MSIGFFDYLLLHILLGPCYGRHPVYGFECQVEGGLAFESGSLRDAFDGGIQVRAISEEGIRKGAALKSKSRIQTRAFLCLTWRTSWYVLTNGAQKKIRSLGLENSIHQHPLFSFFCPGQGLLKFPHQGFPLGDLRISLVENGLRLKAKGIIRFQNHKHAIARPENLDV